MTEREREKKKKKNKNNNKNKNKNRKKKKKNNNNKKKNNNNNSSSFMGCRFNRKQATHMPSMHLRSPNVVANQSVESLVMPPLSKPQP